MHHLYLNNDNNYHLHYHDQGIREGFLHYRYFVNDQRKLKHHLVKNKDQMIATTASGIVNGGLLAYHLRGSWMIIGGAIVYTSFAITGQFLYSMTRRWKQNRSLDKYLKRNEIVILDIPYSLHTRRDRNDFEVIRERLAHTHTHSHTFTTPLFNSI